MVDITLIAAVSLNGTIGSNNSIPWSCPEDLKHFKDTTIGNVVIMGRKTFESLGSEPLKGRDNIVVSSRYHNIPQDKRLEKVNTSTTLTKVTTIREAMIQARSELESKSVFIIGGGEVYHQTIDIADQLIVSHIHIPVEGSIKFPEIDLSEWLIAKIDHRLNGSVPFTIIHYIRK